MDDIDRIIQKLNEQKGEILAMSNLVLSIVRALPIDLQAKVLTEFDKEREITKTVLLNSSAPDDVLRSFDNIVEAFNKLRLDRPGT